MRRIRVGKEVLQKQEASRRNVRMKHKGSLDIRKPHEGTDVISLRENTRQMSASGSSQWTKGCGSVPVISASPGTAHNGQKKSRHRDKLRTMDRNERLISKFYKGYQ